MILGLSFLRVGFEKRGLRGEGQVKVGRSAGLADDEEELEAGAVKGIGAGQMKRQSGGEVEGG